MDARDKIFQQFLDIEEAYNDATKMCQEAPDDGELAAIASEAKDELQNIVQQLNEIDRLDPVVTEGAQTELDAQGRPVVLWSLPAPLQVLYDGKLWYSCVCLGRVMPSGPQDRVRFGAWILGYNVEELVHREALRPWQMEDAGVLSTGVECHAIHRNGWFQK